VTSITWSLVACDAVLRWTVPRPFCPGALPPELTRTPRTKASPKTTCFPSVSSSATRSMIKTMLGWSIEVRMERY
jgi:hypothetical protein